MQKYYQIALISCLLIVISFSSLISGEASITETELVYSLEEIDRVARSSTIMSLEVDRERNLVLASVTFQGFTIYDGNTQNLSEISSLSLGSEYEIAYSNGYAYVACLNIGIKAVNISDPSQPEVVDIHAEGNSTEGTFVEIRDDLLFIGDWSDGIEIVNISDPTNMVLLTSFHPSYEPSPLYLYGDYCYTNVLTIPVPGMPPTPEGLSVIDISNLTNIQEVNFLSNYTGLAPSAHQGNYLFAGGREDGLTIFDVSNPINPYIINQTSDGHGSALQVALDGNFAFLTDEDDGLEVYDISDLVNPQLIAKYDFDAIAIHLRIMNSKVYVGTTKGLSVLELKTENVDTDPIKSPFNTWSMMLAILSIAVIKKRKSSKTRNQN